MAITGLIADKNMNPITDPNPIDVVEDLKNLDDNTLAQYAQDRGNPNATYALVVLMQRKSARDKVQAEAPSDTTVAEDVSQDVTGGGIAGLQGAAPMMADQQGVMTAPPSPDQLTTQGVGSLPAENIGQNYAGGGIVSFQAGGMPTLDPTSMSPYTNYVPDMRGYNAAVRAQEGPGVLGRIRESLFGGLTSRFGEMTKARQKVKELNLEKAQLQKLMDEGTLPRESYYPAIERIKAIETELTTPQDVGGGGYEPGAKVEETTLPTVEKPSLAEQAQAEDKLKQEMPADTTTPLIDQIAREGRDTGIDSLRQKYTEEKGIQDYAEDVRKSQEALGLDKDVYTDMAADIKRDRETLAKSKEEAAGLSMIEAGLMIAGGSSPNALTNLKEAAPAVRNFANSVRDLRAEDRTLKTMEFQIASADQAIKQGRADKALAMLEANRNRSFELDKMDLNNEQTAIQKQLDRENNIKLQQLANMRPSDFDRQLAAAKQSGQYNDENGKFDFTKFYNDFKTLGRTSSAGLDEDTILRAYSANPTDPITGETVTYEQYKQRILGGSTGQLSPDDMALINKYSRG